MQSIDSGSLSFLCNILKQQLSKAFQIITGQADAEEEQLAGAENSLPPGSDLQLEGLMTQHSEPIQGDDDELMVPGKC